LACYVLNSPRLTAFGAWRYDGPLTVEQARTFVMSAPFASAVGHASTARHLSALLGVQVPCRRVDITMQPGDEALVWELSARTREGELLTEAGLRERSGCFGLLRRVG
jgi:hypothetical protein